MDTALIDTSRLKGKRILITGGTTGIGRATAEILASYGVNLVLVGRNPNDLKNAVDISNIEGSESKCIGINADVSKRGDIEKIFSLIKDEFDGLDILINNAAIGYGSITDGDYEDIEYAVKTNIMGYMACTHYALANMKGSNGAHILHVGSMSADTRDAESSVYVATKSAIQGFSEALRKELNPDNIKVTLIEPGAVDTDMQEAPQEEKNEKIRNMEMLESVEIAKTILFVLSQSFATDIVELKIKPLKQII